jgi:hypothetical protein
MAGRPQQLLEGVSHEALGPDGTADSDVNEDLRLEAPALFNGIDSLHKLRRATAPTVVAPGEEGCFVLRNHDSKTRLPMICSVHEFEASARPSLVPSPIGFEFDEQASVFLGERAAVLNKGQVIVLVGAKLLDSPDLPGAIREFLFQSLLQTIVNRRVND